MHSNNPMTEAKRGKVLCRHWARGFCQLGNECNFAHTGSHGSPHRPASPILDSFPVGAPMAYPAMAFHAAMPSPHGSAVNPNQTYFIDTQRVPLYPPGVYEQPGQGRGMAFYPFMAMDPYTMASPSSPSSTADCRHWARGYCALGDGCKFVHSVGASQSYRSKPSRNICRNWAKGSCLQSNCMFSHASSPGSGFGPAPERKSENPCRHFAKGFCERGDACAFSHIPQHVAPSKASKAKEAPKVTRVEAEQSSTEETIPTQSKSSKPANSRAVTKLETTSKLAA